MRIPVAAALVLPLVLVLLFPLPSRAADPVWIEASGEAAGSDLDPPREVLERARTDARRNALERAVGTFVSSHTLVSNGQLAEDLAFARVRGRIEKAEILSEERDPRNPNVYRVRLKALVRPVNPNEEGIRVAVDLSRREVAEGEEVTVRCRVSHDGYVYLFSVASDNSVTLLFPNRLHEENFLKAGEGLVFPPEGSQVKLKAMKLPGTAGPAEERLKVIVTRRKEPLLHGFQEGLFKVYDAASTGLVGDLARKLNQLDPAEWGEGLAVYTIR